MLFLPEISIPNPYTYQEGQSVYLASDCMDRLRIHCVMTEDGTAIPGLFVGGAFFHIN